jgi:hypothetical protein
MCVYRRENNKNYNITPITKYNSKFVKICAVKINPQFSLPRGDPKVPTPPHTHTKKSGLLVAVVPNTCSHQDLIAFYLSRAVIFFGKIL